MAKFLKNLGYQVKFWTKYMSNSMDFFFWFLSYFILQFSVFMSL